MKRKVKAYIAVLIALIVVIAVVYYYNNFCRIAYCKIVERNDKEILLQQDYPGYFVDPTEFGTTKIYILVNQKLVNEFDQMLDMNGINEEDHFKVSFLFNKLWGIERREEGAYIKARKLMKIEESDV